MDTTWKISAYDPVWRDRFIEVGRQLRAVLGDAADRIDHVGSTSVPGLAAKPIIDIQISVSRLENIIGYKKDLESIGFVFREDNPDKTKRYFRETPGNRRTHVHVRETGSFSEQMTLLFRDYLREHQEDCLRYEAEKRRLMNLYQLDRIKYVEGKGPIVWDILSQAHLWSQGTGWKAGEADL